MEGVGVERAKGVGLATVVLGTIGAVGLRPDGIAGVGAE
jgi:hypothetical protein